MSKKPTKKWACIHIFVGEHQNLEATAIREAHTIETRPAHRKGLASHIIKHGDFP